MNTFAPPPPTRSATARSTPASPPPAAAPPAAPEILSRAAALVAPALDQAVQRLGAELRPPVAHHLRGGGKGVRGALVLLSAVAGGSPETAGVVGAVAIELVHNFSLLHDDIIDGDRQRRHRPTAWAQYGVGAAIVAGDGLATLAMQVLLDQPTPERVQAAGRLAVATQEMIAGQAADMAFESRGSVTVAECLAMEEGKTGALLSCAAALGAILVAAPPATVTALGDFGAHLGIAFQAVDDVLGIWGEPAVTGKPVGSDLVAHKKTLPVAVALARDDKDLDELRSLLAHDLSGPEVLRAAELIEASGARRDVMAMADTHLDQAVAALDRVLLPPEARADLLAVAHYVTARDR